MIFDMDRSTSTSALMSWVSKGTGKDWPIKLQSPLFSCAISKSHWMMKYSECLVCRCAVDVTVE